MFWLPRAGCRGTLRGPLKLGAVSVAGFFLKPAAMPMPAEEELAGED